ncbi:MAG: flavin reductase family protein [Lachnospiraceae bacterium]|nr:flavin reductase family protein [Lachnospiraceae bacterium]
MAKQSWKPGNMLYPIPAVMVSCALEGEKPNIITVAWAGNVCSSPAMLSISVRPDRYSHHILKESGEFVVNLVDKKLTRACDWCGVRSGKDYDKFREMHLTPMTMEKVACPGIAESPVNIECKVKQIIPLGSHDLFLAEVVCVDVDEAFLDEKQRLDLRKADLVAYSHGEYFELGEKLGKFGYSVAKKAVNAKKPAKTPAKLGTQKRKDMAKKIEKRSR